MGINELFNYWQRPKLQVFSKQQLEQVYYAALEILERTGSEFRSKEALEILHGAGAYVDDKNVRMPSTLVEDAIRSMGRRVVLSDRNGSRKLFLEGDNTYFGPGSETPNTIDVYTGERRKSTKDDVINTATIVDALDHLDFAMSFALASNVPPYNADCHHFQALVENTTKPILFTAWDLDGLKAIHEMSIVVAGSKAGLRRNPFIMLYDEPSSPLRHSKEAVEKMIYAAQEGIPITYAPAPSLGAAGPISLAGAITLNLAEYLAGLVLTQAIKKGSTLIFGGGPTGIDMKTMNFCYSAPETLLSLALRKEVGDFLGVPTFNAGGFTDSKEIDQQATLEVANSLIIPTLVGGNLIHDVGYLESGMTSSLELLAIAEEEISMLNRFIQSVQVNKETLGVDEINAVGAGGNYLISPSTIKNFRKQIWSPKLLDRNFYDKWESSGKSTLRDRARTKVIDILENYEREPLENRLIKELNEIVTAYERSRSRSG